MRKKYQDRSVDPTRDVMTAVNGIPGEEVFHRMIRLERKRTERSGRRFLLMLANIENLCREARRTEVTEKVLSALASSKRETDLVGWHVNHSIIGVIFIEIGDRDYGLVKGAILGSVMGALAKSLTVEDIKNIQIMFHVFPEENHQEGPRKPDAAAIYPDVANGHESGARSSLIKRTMDLAGSIIGLAVLCPMLFLIAVLVKLSSPGPVLVCQRRLGLLGKSFRFYKFRSMYVNSGHDVHREYVRRLIVGGLDGQGETTGGGGERVYKMNNDARITPLGRILRKTSLDELPQLVNVLRGEMSLVGPRPPLWYEVECYELWHRGRVWEAKPGITGLWQVKGRSRTNFAEMVRLDMKYIREWSVWLDVRILLETPWAVMSGRGAY